LRLHHHLEVSIGPESIAGLIAELDQPFRGKSAPGTTTHPLQYYRRPK
jgi:hypothetical protein